jgi:hypothetical protein
MLKTNQDHQNRYGLRAKRQRRLHPIQEARLRLLPRLNRQHQTENLL